MANSKFWRNLAKAFRALQANSRMRAEWLYIVGKEPKEWTLDDAPRMARIRFEALARRGAAALSDADVSDLLVAWFEALLLASSIAKFRTERSGNEQNTDGTGVAHHRSGIIWRVCEASAIYCEELEGRAREAELRAKLQTQEDQAKTAKTVHANADSVGRQIDRYREEVPLTQEQLAEKMKITTRTVQRHISDACPPRSRHLVGYSSLFSKLLKREIVIKNMS
jgi:DNA-binding transcriptional regulator YiaG